MSTHEKEGRPGMAAGAPEKNSTWPDQNAANSDSAEPSVRAKVEFAVEAASLGYHVFPCIPGKKTPLIKAWETAASCDEAKVRRLWRQCPSANIGAAVGKSGFTVLDVDVKKGKPGKESLASLEESLASLPRTRVARTPSGGLHIHMLGETASSIDRLGKGLDVKSSGGYVLMPGSKLAEGEYTWHRCGPAEPMPNWYANFARPHRAYVDEREFEPPIPTGGLDHPADMDRARYFLSQVATPAVEGEGGDAMTFKVACLLRDIGISEEAALEMMIELYNPRCVPEWPIDDGTNESLKAKVANAYRYANGTAGSGSVVADFPDDIALPDAKPTARKRFVEMGLSDLAGVKSPRWLVHRLVPENGLALVYGQPKAGKTFWTMDLSLSVATGRSFHGLDVRKGRVTYVAAEGGRARLRDRANAWIKARGASPSEAGEWGLIAERVDVSNPAEVADLLRALGGHRDLIVIDTLARCMSGDENSQKDMGAFVAGCDRIREATGAAVLAVHHEGKDPSKGARGSNALRGAIDMGLQIRRAGNVLTASVEDQRDDEPLPPQRFEMRNIVLDGIDQSSVALFPASGTFDDDAARILDIACEMDGAPKKDLDAAVAEVLKLTAVTARRRVSATIGEGEESAADHGDTVVWFERADASNPRSGLIIRTRMKPDAESP